MVRRKEIQRKCFACCERSGIPQFCSSLSSCQTPPAVCLLVLWSYPKENKWPECKTCINVRLEQIMPFDFSLSEYQVTMLLDVKLALKCLEGHLTACILHVPFTSFVHKKATYYSICIFWIYSVALAFLESMSVQMWEDPSEYEITLSKILACSGGLSGFHPFLYSSSITMFTDCHSLSPCVPLAWKDAYC